MNFLWRLFYAAGYVSRLVIDESHNRCLGGCMVSRLCYLHTRLAFSENRNDRMSLIHTNTVALCLGFVRIF